MVHRDGIDAHLAPGTSRDHHGKLPRQLQPALGHGRAPAERLPDLGSVGRGSDAKLAASVVPTMTGFHEGVAESRYRGGDVRGASDRGELAHPETPVAQL